MCVGTRGLLDLRRAYCVVERAFLNICLLKTLVAFLFPTAPHYFARKAMEIGGINLTLTT